MIEKVSGSAQTTLNFLKKDNKQIKRKEIAEEMVTPPSKKTEAICNFSIIPPELIQGILTFLINNDPFNQSYAFTARQLSLTSSSFYSAVNVIQPYRPLLPYFLKDCKGTALDLEPNQKRNFIVENIRETKPFIEPSSVNCWMKINEGSLDFYLMQPYIQNISNTNNILVNVAIELMSIHIGLPFKIESIANAKHPILKEFYSEAQFEVGAVYETQKQPCAKVNTNHIQKKTTAPIQKKAQLTLNSLYNFPALLYPSFPEIIYSNNHKAYFYPYKEQNLQLKLKNEVKKFIGELKPDVKKTMLWFLAQYNTLALLKKQPDIYKNDKTLAFYAIQAKRELWLELPLHLKFDFDILTEYLNTTSFDIKPSNIPAWFVPSLSFVKNLVLQNKKFLISWVLPHWKDEETQKLIAYCTQFKTFTKSDTLTLTNKFNNKLKDIKYMDNLVKINGRLLEFADISLRSNEDLIKTSIKSNPIAFKYAIAAKGSFKTSFLENLITINPAVFKFFSKEAKVTGNLAGLAIGRDFALFKELPENIRKDKQFFLRIAPYLDKYRVWDTYVFPQELLRSPGVKEILGTLWYKLKSND